MKWFKRDNFSASEFFDTIRNRCAAQGVMCNEHMDHKGSLLWRFECVEGGGSGARQMPSVPFYLNEIKMNQIDYYVDVILSNKVQNDLRFGVEK